MRSSSVLGFALFIGPAYCAPAASTLNQNHQKRQLEGLPEAQMQKVKIFSVETLTPKLDKNAIRKKIRFGPYSVPGSKEPSIGIPSDPIADKNGALTIDARIDSLCGGDCVVLFGGAVPEYKNGTALSTLGGQIYNHHIFIANRDRLVPHQICPGEPSMGTMPGVFIGGGTDKESQIHTSSDGKVKSGYFVKANQKLDLMAEFMNYKEKEEIVVAVEFEYLPGLPKGFLNSQPLVVSAAPCSMSSFNVPGKQYETLSKEWTMPADVYVIGARGHQHDGGIGVHLFVNGKNVCSSIPIYSKVESRGKDEAEHFTIKEMQACTNSVALKKGDVLQIKANYDVEKYPQRQSNTNHMEMATALLIMDFGFPLDYDINTFYQ